MNSIAQKNRLLKSFVFQSGSVNLIMEILGKVDNSSATYLTFKLLIFNRFITNFYK